MPSLGTIESLIMDNYSSSPYRSYASTAIKNVNNQTRKRVRDMLSRFSMGGLGRSSTGSVAANEIYSNANANIGEITNRSAMEDTANKRALIQQLLGVNQLEQSQPSFSDVLASVGGLTAGSILGPIGSAVGNKLGGKISNLLGD